MILSGPLPSLSLSEFMNNHFHVNIEEKLQVKGFGAGKDLGAIQTSFTDAIMRGVFKPGEYFELILAYVSILISVISVFSTSDMCLKRSWWFPIFKTLKMKIGCRND